MAEKFNIERAREAVPQWRAAGYGDDEIADLIAKVNPDAAKLLASGMPASETIDNVLGLGAPAEKTEETITEEEVKKAYDLEGTSVPRIMAGIAADVAISEGVKAAGTAAGAKTALVMGQTGPQAATPEEAVTVPVGAAIGYTTGALVGGVLGDLTAQRIENPDKPLSYGRLATAAALNLLPGTELKRGPKVLRNISKQLSQRPVRAQMVMGAAIGPAAVATEQLLETGTLPPTDQLALSSGLSAVLGGSMGMAGKKVNQILKGTFSKSHKQLQKAIYSGDKDAVDYINGITRMMTPEERANLATPKEVLDYIVNASKAELAPSKVVGAKASKIMRDASNAVMAAEDTGGLIGKRVQEAIRNSENPDLANEFALKYLAGETSNVPKEFTEMAEQLSTARGMIREYQEQLLKNHEAGQRVLPEALVEKIEASLNEGDYVTRAYRWFDDPAYKPSKAQRDAVINRLTQDGLSEDQIERRVQKFIKDYKPPQWEIEQVRRRHGVPAGGSGKGNEAYQRDLKALYTPTSKTVESFREKLGDQKMSLAEANEYLAELNAKRSDADFSLSFMRSSNSGILKKKKDVPDELRAYLGEYVEPGEKLAKTMSVIARLEAYDTADRNIASELQRMGVASSGEGVGHDWVPLNLRRGPASIGDQQLFVPPHVQKAVNSLYAGKADEEAMGGLIGAINNAWDTSISLSKATKVVMNPPSYMVQAYGNAFNLAGMGINPVKGVLGGLKAARAQFGGAGARTPEQIKQFKMYKERGLVPPGVTYQDIQAGLRGGAGGLIKKAVDPLGKAYSVPDVTMRVMAFEHHASMLRRFTNGAGDENKILDIAQELTNNTYQNYDYLNKTLRGLSRKGVMPQFASFTMELIRNQYHQGNTIRKMLTGKFADELEQELGVAVNRKEIAVEGAKRLAMLTAVYGGTAAGGNYVTRQYMTPEEEQARRETVLPEWDKQQALVMRTTENGEVQFMNSSYIVPHMTLYGIAQAALRGESFQDSVKSATEALADQFVGEGSFVFRAAAKALGDYDPETGNAISTKQDMWGRFTDKVKVYLDESYEPGIVREMRKAEKQDPSVTAARQLGVRINTTTDEKGFSFRTRKFRDTRQEITKKLSSARYSDFDRLDRLRTKEELGLEYVAINEDYKNNQRELIKHVQNMRVLGHSDDEIIRMMRNNFVRSEDVLNALDGHVADLPIVDKMSVQQIHEQILELPGSDTRKYILEVAKKDRELGKALIQYDKEYRLKKYRDITTRDEVLGNLDSDAKTDFMVRYMQNSKDPEGTLKQYAKKGVVNAEEYRAALLKFQAKKQQ